MIYDLPDLRLVAAIADSGSLTRGAAQVHLAPSSASHRLTQLESALGVPLFTRHARGLNPTGAGESLLRHARQVFADDTQGKQLHSGKNCNGGSQEGKTGHAAALDQVAPNDIDEHQ